MSYPYGTSTRQAFAADICRLMRDHKVTIRQLAAEMDVTMKRVREIRNHGPENGLIRGDYLRGIFACSRFSVASCNAELWAYKGGVQWV